MDIGIKIINASGNSIAIFDRDFFDLQFSEFLDGIGVGQFIVSTQSEMLKLLVPSNIIEIVDLENNDKVIWRGFIRPFTVRSDIATITLTQIKDRLNYLVSTTSGTITSISQLLSILPIPSILNMPDVTFDGIDYRPGMRFYNILEEVRKATSYDWDFDGTTLTFGRIGIDRTDIAFWSEAEPGTCNTNGGSIFIDNIEATFTERYDKVVAYKSSVGVATAGTGNIQIAIDSESSTLGDLQKVADEYLKLGEGRRVITFDVPNIGDTEISVGDKIFTEISGTSDIFLLSDYVRVLKKEVRLENCNLITKIFVSESKVNLRDNYNSLASLERRIANIQTR